MSGTVRKRKPKEIGSFEWESSVAAWRYYEHGHTIASAGYAEDLVERYFAPWSEYGPEARERIAVQFAETDHGLRGEADWRYSAATSLEYDKPWRAFFRFCLGYVRGFTPLELRAGRGKRVRVLAFPCEATGGHWHPVEEYVRRPHLLGYIRRESIIKTWEPEVARW